jgi:phenylacetate-coenzyme A ligase PaaK-like adenylate-forming protein
MVSFTKAFDLLGVEEAYAWCVGADFYSTLASLPKLDPDVIISIPSILEKCFEPLKLYYRNRASHRLKKVIYVGEAISANLRGRMETEPGVEVFGYYGASETSALGIECRAHDGIHLFTNRNVFEIVTDSPSGLTGRIVVTTLQQQTLPLIRYALNDVISLKQGKCPCGLSYPKVDVSGRAGDSFSILGAKFYYEPILKACYNGRNGVRLMRLVLSCEEREKIEIVLPKSLQPDEKTIRGDIFRSQPDLDFLSGSKYLDIQLSFEDESSLADSRKQKRIVDLR